MSESNGDTNGDTNGMTDYIVVSIKAGICQLLPEDLVQNGVQYLRIRTEDFDLEQCRSLILHWQTMRAKHHLAIGLILEWNGQNLPKSKGSHTEPLLWHPNAVPPEFKQQILMAQSLEIDCICLSHLQDPESIAVLKLCLEACGSQAKVLVRPLLKMTSLRLAAMIHAADGVLLSSEDFSSQEEAESTEANYRWITQECRRTGVPMYICVQRSGTN